LNPLSIATQRYLELGDRAFREGRYTDAVQFYAKAVEFAPDQGALYLVLSDALFASGDYHYAAYAIRRALELDPSLVDTRVDKHAFYASPEQFDEHLRALERYTFEHPDDRDARLVLALNYLFGARAGDAVRILTNTSIAEDTVAQRVLERAKSLP
jgi:tetratricopeptide (TPR) repeat protein